MSDNRRKRRTGAQATLLARGEPMLWVAGSALVICFAMIVVLLGWVVIQGLSTFWPGDLVRVDTKTVPALGELTRVEWFRPEGSEQEMRRRLVRTANADLSGETDRWVVDSEVVGESRPEWAVVVERLEWGRFHGFPTAYAELLPIQVGVERDDWDEAAARREATTVSTEVTAGFDGEVRWHVERSVGNTRFDRLVPVGEAGDGDRVLSVAKVEFGEPIAWQRFQEKHGELRGGWADARHKRKHEIGAIASDAEDARIALREAELAIGPSPVWVAARKALRAARLENETEEVATLERRLRTLERDLGTPPQEYVDAFLEFVRRDDDTRRHNAEVTAEIVELESEIARHALYFESAEGTPNLIRIPDVVRAYAPNQLGLFGKLGVYLSRWWEFLADDPRESNAEGGVFPAIFGTVLMTLLMCVVVVPFGVLAALYLGEYAKAGPVISLMRIAINNLAGVPSIVFGVFGLGFFCYIVGASIDDLLFEARLPAPTFGKSGMLWASLTLALMTLPVVIVATEEALSAVPSSARQGSFACGASRWQTIRRIVLPRAMPGIMTGAILAMARGAGEVAPLMLVGAVKLAPELPIDSGFPFGLDRSFMHLGFHIYDLGFQSPDSEAARPMVYTTTLLLISIIALLNVAAIWLRSRLRRKFVGGQF